MKTFRPNLDHVVKNKNSEGSIFRRISLKRNNTSECIFYRVANTRQKLKESFVCRPYHIEIIYNAQINKLIITSTMPYGA